MKIALLPNLTRKNASEVTKNVCEYLKKYSVDYYFEKELENQIHGDNNFLTDDELFTLCDVVIAIGGDGSIIHAAKKACLYNKPILGINAGNLAFMAGVEKHELNLLEKLVNGEYTIDKRMMLKVEVTDGVSNKVICSDLCLNDIVIARGEMIKLIKLNVSCDGKDVNEYYADGIILSTPTGSTAYSLSCGGPVVDPRIESIILTPICTHSLFARSIIFDSESEICVTIPEDSNDQICVSSDGGDSIEISPGSNLTIRKSKINADIIRIKNDSFIDVLNSKLAQRRV